MLMQIDTHRAKLGMAILALSALLAGCGTGTDVVVDAAAPTAAFTAGALVPTAAPDPAPGQTTSPGQHLEVIGTITALGSSTVDVDGTTYNLTATTEVKGSLAAGEQVKLEYLANADGSRTVIEAKSVGFFDDSGSSSVTNTRAV